MPLDGAGTDREDDITDEAPAEHLRIFQVMPREMYFGASRATSIDLCVRDLVSFTRFRATTRIFAEATGDCFAGFTIDPLPPPQRAATFRRANHVARAARRERPDLIVVQQHLPTAAAIALRLPGTKVVLFVHNFQKSYAGGLPVIGALGRRARQMRYARLAGIIHVSETCRRDFAENWQSVTAPGCVVNNGLDFNAWMPAAERMQEILCVGRCAPEKGILEAAQGLAAVLPNHPGWRARFILSAIAVNADYFRKTEAALAGLGEQAVIEVQRPFDEIKAACERAAIALVPSKWREPFGRTALEAHAGGAALITSGTGGLAEISGGTALYLPEVTADAIAGAAEMLIGNPEFRMRLAQDGAEQVRTHFDVRKQAAQLDAFCRAIAAGALRPAQVDRNPASHFSAADPI